MKCPKCGYDEGAHQEKKAAKIMKMQEWLDSEPDEYCEKHPCFREIVAMMLKLYRDSDNMKNDNSWWASICAILRSHPFSPIRRGSDG